VDWMNTYTTFLPEDVTEIDADTVLFGFKDFHSKSGTKHADCVD